MKMYEVEVEEGDGVVVITQEDEQSKSVVILSPEQVGLFCMWVGEAAKKNNGDKN